MLRAESFAPAAGHTMARVFFRFDEFLVACPVFVGQIVHICIVPAFKHARDVDTVGAGQAVFAGGAADLCAFGEDAPRLVDRCQFVFLQGMCAGGVEC